jgi:uncharacterized protein (TIGR03435 family)
MVGGQMTRTGAVWVVAAVLGVCVSAQQPKATFEGASVKLNTSGSLGWSSSPRPDGSYSATNVPLRTVIQFAYGIREDQLLGGPGWLQVDRFDINAKPASDGSLAQLRLMLQGLLEDRFKLVTRREQRDLPTFALLLARRDGQLGPNLKRVDDCSKANANQASRAVGSAGSRGCGPMALVVLIVSEAMGGPVIDKTGLTGTFDVSLSYSAETVRRPAGFAPLPDTLVNPDLPSLPSALQEQLGLKLETSRGPTDVLLIDSVSQPTEN